MAIINTTPQYRIPVSIGRGFQCGQGVIKLFDVESDLTSLGGQGQDFDSKVSPYKDIMDIMGDGWECGHILGRQFGGGNSIPNFLPMSSKANHRFLDDMERKVRAAIECFPVISTYLMTKNNFKRTYLEYRVFASNDTIDVNGLYIPRSIHATLSIIDSLENEIDCNLVNDLPCLRDKNLQMPLDFQTNVNY